MCIISVPTILCIDSPRMSPHSYWVELGCNNSEDCCTNHRLTNTFLIDLVFLQTIPEALSEIKEEVLRAI